MAVANIAEPLRRARHGWHPASLTEFSTMGAPHLSERLTFGNMQEIDPPYGPKRQSVRLSLDGDYLLRSGAATTPARIRRRSPQSQYGGHASLSGAIGGITAVLLVVGFFGVVAYILLHFCFYGRKSIAVDQGPQN
jgi:hypothetical protein